MVQCIRSEEKFDVTVWGELERRVSQERTQGRTVLSEWKQVVLLWFVNELSIWDDYDKTRSSLNRKHWKRFATCFQPEKIWHTNAYKKLDDKNAAGVCWCQNFWSFKDHNPLHESPKIATIFPLCKCSLRYSLARECALHFKGQYSCSAVLDHGCCCFVLTIKTITF